MAELSHHKDIERRTERSSYLGRDRHPAARQADHNGPLGPQPDQGLCQLAAGISTVTESHLILPVTRRTPPLSMAA
jgi:hypothetical protein